MGTAVWYMFGLGRGGPAEVLRRLLALFGYICTSVSYRVEWAST